MALWPARMRRSGARPRRKDHEHRQDSTFHANRGDEIRGLNPSLQDPDRGAARL